MLENMFIWTRLSRYFNGQGLAHLNWEGGTIFVQPPPQQYERAAWNKNLAGKTVGGATNKAVPCQFLLAEVLLLLKSPAFPFQCLNPSQVLTIHFHGKWESAETGSSSNSNQNVSSCLAAPSTGTLDGIQFPKCKVTPPWHWPNMELFLKICPNN